MAKPIPMETEEELQFVKDFVLLQIVLDVLERDARVMEVSPLKMKPIYVQVLSGVQDQVTAELAILRRHLREHGMKVYEQRRTSDGVEALYVCRGYHHEFMMLWALVKAEVERRLRHYLRIELTGKGVRT